MVSRRRSNFCEKKLRGQACKLQVQNTLLLSSESLRRNLAKPLYPGQVLSNSAANGMDEDEKSQYEEKLLELVERGADRNIIALLTEIAEEHANLSESNAVDIVKIIEKRIKEVFTALPAFFLSVLRFLTSLGWTKKQIACFLCYGLDFEERQYC